MVRACAISNSPLARAAQVFQVRAAAEQLAQIVGDRAQVGAAGTVRPHARQRAVQIEQGQLVDLHRHRRQLHRDGLARQLVSAAALHFLGGDRRRSLQELAAEAFERLFERGRIDLRFSLLAGGLAGAVVSVGRPAEADHTFVDFVAARVKLRQARGAAEHQRQHAGGDRVERAQVADLLHAGDPPRFPHYVVRGPAFRFVDDDGSVQAYPFGFGWQAESEMDRKTGAPAPLLALARQAHMPERKIAVAISSVQKRQDQGRRDYQDRRRNEAEPANSACKEL